MAKTPVYWRMNPGETLSLGVSLEGDMNSGAGLIGTPTVEVYTKSGSTYTLDETFTVTAEQVNDAEMTDANGDAIPIGKGVKFRLAVPAAAQGDYWVKVSCGTDDSDNPVTERRLAVKGA